MQNTLYSIHELEPRQEIVITASFGNPHQSVDVTTHVVVVSGGSALCANGMCLADCNSDADGVTLTGNIIYDGVISPEALELLSQTGQTAYTKEPVYQ